jgi:hypothetical protein
LAGYLTVCVPAGIGDFSWIYSKLVCLSKKLRVMTVAGMSRASQMCGILPMVESAVSGRLSYPQLRVLCIGAATPRSFFESHDPDEPIAISANDYIMDQPGGYKGQRLETWLPELATDFHYDLNTDKYICIYGASDTGVAAWRGWDHSQWFKFMTLVKKGLPGVGFVMIGAQYDTPLAQRLSSLCAANGVPMVDMAGKTTLAQALDVIKRSVYMVAFPSGLPIMATVMRKPVFMFFPAGGMESMINTWVNPEMIADKSYIGSVFAPPEVVWTRMIDEYKLPAKMDVKWGDNVKDVPVVAPPAADPTVASVAMPMPVAGPYSCRAMVGSAHERLKSRRDAIRARRAKKGLRVK